MDTDTLIAAIREAIFAARDGGASIEEIEAAITEAVDDLEDPDISG